MIDSLYLGNGGGIISASQKSKQYDGAAAVAIGIGGTGCDALSELKQKVYAQLIPDDPDSDLPRYDHIQFLAIDSDETANGTKHGYARLDSSEFFSIYDPQIMAKLTGKNVIKSNPLYNWMDIDKIDRLLNPQGAGGIRQIGRYLLTQRAGELYNKIQQLCKRALTDQSPHLDVYIFAGISGGTGSGCFIDTCYIVRKVLEDNGWASSGNIMGFFFLPDVVISKPEVMANDGAVSYNSSNGYAAMKELDYLMNLKVADDRFRQNYGTFKIDTQATPVDMCHLISATDASGTPVKNGYRYGLNVVSDYVIAYLSNVELGGATAGQDGGLTMQGHLANVGQGVNQLRNQYGASRSYHILGSANAEVPMTQFATYLACGFYRKFLDKVWEKPNLITKSGINEWSKNLGIDCEDAYMAVINDMEGRSQINLPDIDYASLKNYGPMKPGFLPQPWSQEVNDYLSRAEGVRKTNCTALAHELASFQYDEVTSDSYIGRVFRKLIDESVNPEYGPYYAAEMLSHAGYDLLSVVDGVITTAEERKKDVTRVLSSINGSGYRDYVSQCSVDFCEHPRRRYYQIYKDAATQYGLYQNQEKEWQAVVDVMSAFKSRLKELYNDFFKPLRDLLESLKETFKANETWLVSDKSKASDDYTVQILGLSDVKDSLDEAIKKVEDNQLVNKFIGMLLDNCRDWQNEERIAMQISRYIEDLFNVQINKSLSTYLYQRFPQAANPTELADCVQKQVIGPIYDKSTPLFWLNNAIFSLNAGNAFESSRLSVPSSVTEVCDAASGFATGHPNFSIRQVGLKDRIFSLRLCSGIPFYAYQGLTLLKGRYDEAASKDAGVGSHLYARTPRDKGSIDWRYYLPTPLPYSLFPDMVDGGEKANALYDEGLKKGVIVEIERQGGATEDAAQLENNVRQCDYYIRKGEEIKLPDYSDEGYIEKTFRDNGYLQVGKINSEISSLQKKLEGLHKAENCTEYTLRNNGDIALGEAVVERVRRDYFIQYPKPKQTVRDELGKLEALGGAIERLQGVLETEEAYQEDLALYADAIFYDYFDIQDAASEKNLSKIVKILYHYTDNRGDAKDLILSDRSKPFKNLPIYQGFLTYREIPAKNKPRNEIDEKVRARRLEKIKAGDGWNCCQLEKEWDQNSIKELEEEIARMDEKDKKDILRFYEYFRDRIKAFRDLFPTTALYEAGPEGEAAANAPAAAPAQAANAFPPPPPMPEIVYVWDDELGRYLTVYTTQYKNYGWDAAMNTWVLLKTGTMRVAYPDGSFRPIQLDAQGNIIY